MENKSEYVPISGYEEYLISRNGDIIHPERKVSVYERNNKKYVAFYNATKKINRVYAVHRLVAKHFIPNPYNLSTVYFKDGNTLNVSAENLYWNKRLLCVKEKRVKAMDVLGRITEFNNICEAAEYLSKRYGCKISTARTGISRVINNKGCKYQGYKWEEVINDEV